MTAFADLSELINRFTGGNSGNPQNIFFYKSARVGGAVATAPVIGRWTSLWEYEGVPAHGAAPTATGAALDNTTDGGLKQTDPSGGRELWCAGATCAGANPGTLLFYDRLAHDGTFSGTTTGAQTVSFTPPSRYSTGAGNCIYLEINTIIGSTATTVQASYTNQAGTSGRTTQAVAIGGTGLREANRLIMLPLQAGDTGVQNIASVTLAATTGTAGAFSVILAHPLLNCPTGLAAGSVRDLVSQMPSLIEIEIDACIAMAFFAGTITALEMIGSIHMAER